jgi:glycosyltransferase involved in cell wall biosynthesis
MTKKKQIVFVNQSSGYLMIDIVNEFKDVYDERILMAGLINPRNNPVDDTVRTEKIAAFNRSSFVKRISSWTFGFLKVVWLIKTKYRHADLFLVSNPPFTTFIPLLCSNNYKLLIYDIYPDALVEFKYLNKDSSIIKLWEKINRRIFSKAEKIYTLTEGMKNRILNYASEKNIQIVPIWTDNEFLKPIVKAKNPFVKQQKWENKFVVMYSGNLGKSHPVELLVSLAKRCVNPKIHFVIIGGGDKYAMIEELVVESNLTNISVLPWLNTELIPQSLSAADIGVVTLGDEAMDLSIPSKTFNIMSVAKPILAICSDQAALAKLIKATNVANHSPLSKRKLF